MSTMQIVMLVVIVITVAISLILSFRKRRAFKDLQTLLAQGRYDEFFQKIDEPFVRASYPEYNLTYFKLNAYLLKGDVHMAYKVLDDLLSRDLRERARVDLVIKAFNIYIGQEDGKRAKKMLREIEGWDASIYGEAQKDCRRTYDIVIGHSHSYIDEIEAELNTQTDELLRKRLLYYLALQYQSAGDKKKADELLSQV